MHYTDNAFITRCTPSTFDVWDRKARDWTQDLAGVQPYVTMVTARNQLDRLQKTGIIPTRHVRDKPYPEYAASSIRGLIRRYPARAADLRKLLFEGLAQ